VDLGVLPPGLYEVVAGPGNLLVAIAEGTLPVSDADPQFRIEPNVAPASGGLVRVSGTNVATCVGDPASQACHATVTFGDIAVSGSGTSPNAILVFAPPHAPGIVDVTVHNGLTIAGVRAAFDYLNPEAPEPAFFERILLPVLYTGPGSFGSKWRTEAAVFNGNPYPLESPRGVFNVPCFPICDPRPQPNSTTFLAATNLPNGFVSWVSRQAAKNLQFSLVVRDLSRDASAFGTSVPVVRENEFFDRPFSLVNVPADSRYRLGLRLYAYEAIPTAVRLRFFVLNGTGEAIGERNVVLFPAPDHAFAFLGDLAAQFPEIAGRGPLRIEVTPLQEGTLAWGYVSITNNETQHVTVIAPE
jgi:hypothetical protein